MFLHDWDTGKTKEIPGNPFFGAISDDGRYIAFVSSDEDLSPWGDDADNIFVFDQQTEGVTQVTSFNDGSEVNAGFSWVAISGDGKYIGFGHGAESGPPYSDVFLSENPFLFSINSGLNDAWYNPETPGQGFWITVYPELGKVALAWLTYDTELPADGATANLGDPGHRWLTAVGNYVDNKAFMNITLTSGGIFDAPSDVQHTFPKGSDGTIILTFNNCNSAIIEYDITSIDRQGIIPIRRIAGDNIETCEALNTD